MYRAHGVRTVAVALGVVTVAVATAAVATTDTAPRTAAAPTVTITRGLQHQQREPRTRQSTTAECEQSFGIACYDPVQIQLRAKRSKRCFDALRIIGSPFGNGCVSGLVHPDES